MTNIFGCPKRIHYHHEGVIWWSCSITKHLSFGDVVKTEVFNGKFKYPWPKM